MPLLHKKPFVKNKIDLDRLKDTDEVFYCTQTGEAFEDYEKFCERVYECNALQWSCSYTGKSSLTYKEALESEESAKKMLKEFPMELRLPILYLATLTGRTTLKDLSDDVLSFVRNRYFVGEMVEVQVDSSWKECHILQVHLPSSADMKKAATEFEKIKNVRKFFPPAELMKYEVEVLNDDTCAAEMNKDFILVVEADNIRRKKFVYTQEKNRLFLRQFVECDGPNGKAIWKVKDSVMKKYSLEKVQWSKIFAGSAPKFYQQTIKPPTSHSSGQSGKRKSQQPTLDHFVTKKSSPPKLNGNNTNAAAAKTEREAKEKEAAEKKRITLEEIARKQKEERVQMQEKKKQDRLKLAEFIKVYQKKKDDLELEDLKDLPEPCPIRMKLPNKYFGHLVQVLEFANVFDKFVGHSRFFPKRGKEGGLTFEVLEEALLESEVEGPLNDLLQMLLSAVYHVLELEDEEMDDSTKSRFVQYGSMDKTITESSDPSLNLLCELASKASHWALHTQGCEFPKIPVDYYTITEVLRLHLLFSGNKANESLLRWRYEQRGGYRPFDDPALLFRQKRPDVMEQLALKSVYELSLEDKIEILQVLIDQTLTYAHVRDMIEENIEKARQNRYEYRMNVAGVMKREREAVFKLKEQKKEIKEKDKLEEIDKTIAEMMERNKDKLQDEYIRTLAGSRGPQQLALGRDRAFRRYWLFKSVPGLYVEHSPDNFVGECIPGGTPCIDKLNMPDSDTLEYMKRLFEGSNNKENLGNRTLVTALSTPVKNYVKEGLNKSSTEEKNSKPRVAWVCSGQRSTCQVHNTKPDQTVWYYFKSEEDIDKLIATLSDRGLREHDLKETLTQEKERIVRSLPNVPFFVVTPVETMETESKENLNHDFVLDLALRDQLLDLEYKITAGGLGTLRVGSVSAWRKELEEGVYDEKIRYRWPDVDKLPAIPDQEHEKVKELLETDYKFSEILDALFDSTLSISSKLQGLKAALLQLEQCVTPKFIGRPLGFGKPSRKVVNQVSNLKQHWEASLNRCTSLSQVFVHLGSLEKSIQWSKSLLKTSCKLCKTRADPEQMLLCDSCDGGFHTYCLTPKLKNIPEGDWHCPTCKPMEKKSKAKKAPKSTEPVEEEKKTVFGKCKVCLDKVPLITCDQCNGGYHMACLEPPLRKIPRGTWTCQPCRRLSAVMKRDEDEEATRSSHRKSSRAASSRISHIAQQILSNRDDDYDESDENNRQSPLPVSERKRKSRHSVEPIASDLPLDNAVLQEILDEVMHDPNAWPFLRPVSKNDVPDYHLIISQPMDFGTIKHKLNMFQYRNNSEVLYDCNLVFDNCCAYNKENSEIYESGAQLRTQFDKLCKERHLFYIEEDISPTKQSKRRKK